MSKRDYVCFDCRSAVRREPYSGEDVLCPTCGNTCFCLGYKIPIPAKSKVAEWKKIENQVISEQFANDENRNITNVRRKHALEKEIAKFETRPQSSGIIAELKRLRRALKRYDA